LDGVLRCNASRIFNFSKKSKRIMIPIQTNKNIARIVCPLPSIIKKLKRACNTMAMNNPAIPDRILMVFDL
jgi:hypothetical protein